MRIAWILALLLGCPSTQDEPVEPIPPFETMGPYAVGHRAEALIDSDRDDRPIPLDLWYPADSTEGGWPTEYPLQGNFALPSEHAFDLLDVSEAGQTLIVFSHGYGGINTQSVELMESLASHGFVVASPEHTGNSQGAPGDDFDTAGSHRVPDVSFVIDTLQAWRDDPEDPLFGRIGDEGVGVAGHSFGGMTALGSVAGWGETELDPRVDAVVPISAVIDGDLQDSDRTGPYAGFSAEELGAVTAPVLLIGGTLDTGVPIENNRLAYSQLTASPVVLSAEIAGANHTHFANVCALGDYLISLGLEVSSWPALGAEGLVEPYEATCSEDAFPIAEVNRLVQTLAVSFFAQQLRGEDAFDDYLTRRWVEQEDALTLSERP